MAAKSAGSEKRVDLVLEGGGVKGVALAGALSALEDEGFKHQNVAGASAGAIIASLLAAGYKAAEIGEIIAGQDFKLFMDKGWEDQLPRILGPLTSVLKDQGIYEGGYFLNLMKELLAVKNIHTFHDLINPGYEDQPKYKYKVQIIASDITKRRLLVLPRDAHYLGLNPDDLGVAEAVRMSMSFPIFFEPYHVRDPQGGEDHLIVDGGLLSNFPVWLFDSDGKPEWPTFGLKLVEEDNKTSLGERLPVLDFAGKALNPTVSYIMNLVSTALEARDRMYIENNDFVRTIAIPTLGVSTLDFKLPKDKVDALYNSGRTAAYKFLATWDFNQYIFAYRSGNTISRRENIVEQMSVISSRAKNRKTLSSQGTLISQIKPRYTWKQLNLPKTKLVMLNDIVTDIQKKNTRTGDRLGNRNVLILFTGPGTAEKRIAVECITKDLGLDLYRIDLSSVVSKYIGETEKNLIRLFDTAKDGGAILFFDEADALFGKRSEIKDSHDKYEKMAINHLFQTIKAYKGLVILATKTKDTVHPPLMRRPQYVVGFPRPTRKPS
jgi:NTE family protein